VQSAEEDGRRQSRRPNECGRINEPSSRQSSKTKARVRYGQTRQKRNGIEVLPEHLCCEKIYETKPRSVISIPVYRTADGDIASEGVGTATSQIDTL
jgi:hypothetical protein